MSFNRHRYPGGRIPVHFLFVLAKTFVLGAAVKLLWNFALPPLTGIKMITYWQALALFLLCRILLGGTGFFNPAGRGTGHWKGQAWRNKWMQMTPEEREKFQQEWRKRWRGSSS